MAATEGPPPSSLSSSPQPPATATAKTGEVEAIALRQRRARFREHCERWAAVLGQCAVRVWHLQRVLQKQVDAVSNERFLDVVLQSGASSPLCLDPARCCCGGGMNLSLSCSHAATVVFIRT